MRILVVDVFNVARAAFHIVPETFRTPDGRPVNAIKGFVNCLGAAMAQFHPDELILAADGPVSSRKAYFPAYKATREKAPAAFTVQIPMLREFARRSGYCWIESPTGEADDVLAAVVAQRPSAEVLLYTSDKDAKGLISDRVKMLARRGDGSGLLSCVGPDDIQRKDGVMPSQFPDYLALIGDTEDNIPGVDGVGPRTAAKLLAQFGSADAIYADIDRVKGAAREWLKSGRESFVLSRRLVQLDSDVPLPAACPVPNAECIPQIVDAARELGLAINVSKLIRRGEPLELAPVQGSLF